LLHVEENTENQLLDEYNDGLYLYDEDEDVELLDALEDMNLTGMELQ
jgi:hypothetical protein